MPTEHRYSAAARRAALTITTRLFPRWRPFNPSALKREQAGGNRLGDFIVDAGIGRPSQACEAMEMGAAAVMSNTAIATAGDIPMMANAFKKAIEAGRQAYLSGLGRVIENGASASSPLTGFLES